MKKEQRNEDSLTCQCNVGGTACMPPGHFVVHQVALSYAFIIENILSPCYVQVSELNTQGV